LFYSLQVSLANYNNTVE